MFNRVRFVYPCLFVVAVAFSGCHNAPTAAPAQAVTPTPAPQPPPTQTTVDPPKIPTTPPAANDALNALLMQDGSPFPKGTQIRSVEIKDGVAKVDFSKEFSALANMGDSTEAAAQKTLRTALAQFPEVQSMLITVEGKPFDSQVTDWSKPIPVRDAAPSGGQ